MVEKKRSLTVATSFVDFAEIDEKKKDQVKKYFPAYFSDDENVMREEVNNQIFPIITFPSANTASKSSRDSCLNSKTTKGNLSTLL